MKNKNFFVKFKNSIYNMKEFPNYIREGVGRAVLYALILSFIVGVIQGLTNSIYMKKTIDSSIEMLEEDKYKFKIENGILDLETSPLKIEDGNLLIYLDDNKELSQVDELRDITVHSDFYILVLKDGIVTSSSLVPDQVGEVAVSQAKYSVMEDGVTITNDNIVDILKVSSNFIYWIIVIVSVVETFLGLIMDSVIIALMLMLTNFMFGLRLRYSQLFSLVIYVATLPVILILILNMFVPDVYLDSVRVLGTFLYSFMVLRNMRHEIDENIPF